MKTLKKQNIYLLASVLVFASACKRSEPPPSTQAPEPSILLPMPPSRTPEAPPEQASAARDVDLERALDKRYAGDPSEKAAVRKTMNELDAKLDAQDRLAEINRRNMVTPAPPGFKPDPVARKVRLRLILEKNKIRAGERPRVRLEMTNVGRTTIEYSELRSSFFVKDGGLLDSDVMRFYLVDSRKKRTELLPPTFPPAAAAGRPGEKLEAPPRGLTGAQLDKWFTETNAMGQAHATFKVKLLPGETLHSVGDDDSPVENFKTLITEKGIVDTPGTYRLHVELDDRPEPLDKDFIDFSLSFSTLEEIHKSHDRRIKDALGPVSSNRVTLEVTR